MNAVNEDLKVGARVKVATSAAYPSCVEDGCPFLDVGEIGTVVMVDPTNELPALYFVLMDNNPTPEDTWVFWHSEVEELK